MPFGGLLTVGLIGAGTGLIGAGMASHAAGKAADQQAEASDKALALQREMYQQQRADTAPWRNAGGQAVGTLSSLMGLPSGPVTQPQTWGPPAGAIPNEHGVGFGILQPGVTPEQARDPNFQYQPQGAMRPPAPPGGGPMVSLAPPPQQQNASSYVQMRAPTGEVQPVPADQVGHFEQMGAVRVRA